MKILTVIKTNYTNCSRKTLTLIQNSNKKLSVKVIIFLMFVYKPTIVHRGVNKTEPVSDPVITN